MKKVFLFGFIALLLSCQDGQQGPSQVVRTTFQAALDGDREAFFNCYLAEDQQKLKLAIGLSTGSGWVPKNLLQLLQTNRILSENIYGDYAAVSTEGRSGLEIFCLEKSPQGWKLSLRTAALPEGCDTR